MRANTPREPREKNVALSPSPARGDFRPPPPAHPFALRDRGGFSRKMLPEKRRVRGALAFRPARTKCRRGPCAGATVRIGKVDETGERVRGERDRRSRFGRGGQWEWGFGPLEVALGQWGRAGGPGERFGPGVL